MKSRLGGTLALAAGIVLAGIAPGISPSWAADHVKIGVVRSMGGAPLYVAQDMGFYKDEGLDAELVWFDAAQPVAVAAASGDVDFGSTGMTAAFLNLAAQGTLKIIGAGTWEHKGFQSIGFMVSNQAYAAGVHSIKDLAGHSVGLTQVGTPLHFNIAMALEKSGVDLKSVRIVPLQSNPNVASALKGGQIDAAVQTSANIYPLIERGDAKLLGWASDFIEGQSEATFANTKFANEHPDTVKKFMTAFRKAEVTWDAGFVDKDGKRADQPSGKKLMEIASKNLGAPPDVLAKGIPYYDPQSRVALADVQRSIDWYYAQGMIKEKLDAASLVDKRFALFAPAVAGK
jgi:NitT/TauT family transport system substrate-binding protein